MSNNIWNCGSNKPWWEERGLDCSAENRIPGFIRVYNETAPDVIGLQECGPKMSEPLMLALQEHDVPYAMLFGRYTSMLYRADKLELIDSEYRVFPETIDGFEGKFNDAKSKSYCLGVFRTKDEGKLFIFITTHLWWKSSDPQSAKYQPFSDEARLWQLQLLCGRLDALRQQYGCAALLAGDLNAVLCSPALQSALSQGWQHARFLASACDGESSGLHRCGADGYDAVLPQSSFSQSIDHILCKGMGEDSMLRYFRHMPQSALSLSDHAAVCTDVLL
jgi:endonuclease/exonuclease/phosphatase family metal-dependent hydrolase